MSAPGRPTDGAAAPAQLTLAHFAGAPLRAPARHVLDDVGEVVIGRAARATAARAGEAGRRQLALGYPDAWISRHHARLVHDGAGGWQVEDLGSRNGLHVNGSRVAAAVLHDGDVLAIGRTFWVLRTSCAPLPPGAPAAASPEDDALHSLHPALAASLARARAVAATAAPIVLAGPAGAGKEELARALHRASGRRGALVALHVGAPARVPAASELAPAAGGTLLVELVSALSPDDERDLVAALDEVAARDVRLLVATARPLGAGALHVAVVARRGALTLPLPPLADRRDDLGALLAAALRRAAPDRAGALTVEPALAAWLFAHPWPGDARQLAHVVSTLCAAAAATGATELRLADLPATDAPGDTEVDHTVDGRTVDGRPAGTPAAAGASEPEDAPSGATRRDVLVAALRRHRGNVAAVARELRTSRSQVRRLAVRHGLDLDAFRA